MYKKRSSFLLNDCTSLHDKFIRGSRHCVKSVQIPSFFSVFSPNTGKYGPEKIPYLDTFHAV